MRVGMKLAVLVFAGTTGCSDIREARMALPPVMASNSDTLRLKGMGAGRSGDFMLEEASGRFARSADRIELFDRAFVGRTGTSSFTLAGGLAGSCRYHESEMNAGAISLAADQFALTCDFSRNGHRLDAELLLDADDTPIGRLDGGTRRVGILRYEGAEITLVSVHRDRAGGLPMPAPLGFVFKIGGRSIGALETNGTGRVLHVPRDAYREAVVAGALALATLWDPADLKD